jgi:excisionase family DNA binding protein
MTGEEKQDLISVREAARECGRNMETVRRWIWAGKLPAEKLGNQLFIKKEDLASYCRESAVKYRAGPDYAVSGNTFDIAEEIRQMREEQMNQFELKQQMSGAVKKPGSRAGLIKKIKTFKEEIRARVGNLDATETIEQLRQERINGLTGLR